MHNVVLHVGWLAWMLLALAPLARAGERPNVVLVLADDLGFSDLGCYGGEIATPNLDRLAAGGLRFTQAYNTSKCFPSRACLLTGAYAQDVGMDRSPGVLRNAVTLAEVLRSAGYRTLMAGKHHGTENPHDRGFDRVFGLRDGACNHFNPGERREGEPAPAQKRPNRAWCIDGRTVAPYSPPPGFYTTDAFTDAALAFLEEGRGEERPFFLYLAYTAPHDPLQAWPRDIERYAGAYEAGYGAIRAARWRRQRELGLFGEGVALSSSEHRDWSALDEAERADQARRMQVYAAMIDRLDQNVGRLVALLEELGALENTLFVFASDNGASAEVVRIGEGEIGSMTRWASLGRDWANVSNTPLRRYKNHSYEGGICTPLLVHWPAGTAGTAATGGGGVVRAPVHFVDLMPTLIELAGASYPETHRGAPVVPLRGVSLAPLLGGGELARDRPLFWRWGRGRAVRDGRWKLVRHGDAPWELYDLESDRTETRDLAAQHLARVTSLAAAWEAWSGGR